MNLNNQNGSNEPQVMLSYDSLTNMQKQKYNYLKGLIGDETSALKLVTLIEGRGKNSFGQIVNKMQALDNADQPEVEYNNSLYENFDLDSVYTVDTIISTVSQVRKENGMEPYTSGWKQKCLNDFYKLFIVHEVYIESVSEGLIKKQFCGYKPVFKLMSGD